MRPVNAKDLRALADQLERTSRILRVKGDEAVRRARDWATPLSATSLEPGRGKGSHADPTVSLAMSDHPDPNLLEHQLLSVDAGQAFDAVVALESRVSRIATDAVIENQRAGIGTCTCGRYCDGSPSNRLRADLCPACTQQHRRNVRTA